MKKDNKFFWIAIVGSTDKNDKRRSIITCSSRNTINQVEKLIKSYTNNGQPFGNWHKEILAKGQDFCIKRIDAIAYDVVKEKVSTKNVVRKDYRLKYVAEVERNGLTVVSGKGSGRDEKYFF